MEHLKLFVSRINIPKMIGACERAHLWPELVFLYCHYDEWDNAALAMIERAADALPADPDLDVPLTHPGLLPDLTRAANALGYLMR